MSMIMQYVRIRPDELAHLRELVVTDPDGAYDYVDELADAAEDRSLDTDKAWDALAFLLRRSGPPPVDPVDGGTALTADEWGYGPPRCLSADEVAQAAAHLAATPFDTLAAHFDPAAMSGVYPEGWAEPGRIDYLRGWYESLVAYFVAAAGHADAVVVYLS